MENIFFIKQMVRGLAHRDECDNRVGTDLLSLSVYMRCEFTKELK